MPDNKQTPDIKCYRINYDSKYWANVAAVVGNQCSSPVGAVFAVNALCDAYEDIAKQRDELLAALEKMNRAYVILMESARDRICDLGGECDGIEVMEINDPYLRESRAAIASVKGEQ